jgi:hypothetical protein
LEHAARLEDAMELLDRSHGVREVLEDVMHSHLAELAVLEGPGKLLQVVDDIDARQRHEIVVDPAGEDLVAAAQMEPLRRRSASHRVRSRS